MVGGKRYRFAGTIGHRLGSFPVALIAAGALVACGRDPGAVDRIVGEGVAHAHAGDTAAALADFDRALALDPDHPAALVNGGLAALIEGRPAEARARLERYLADHGIEILPRVYLAHALLALDDKEGAIAALQQAVNLGFRDLGSLVDGSFGALQNDLRFIQLATLVAQRNGQRAPVDDRGRLLVGNAPVRSLSGPGLETSCAAPASPPHE